MAASRMSKRITGVFGRSKSTAQSSASAGNDYNFDNAPVDSPEGNVNRSIRMFCESGSASNGGDEVLHLPVIVDAAESSPVAAAAAAQQIRKFLSKEWATKPHVQYNSVMLIRILSDNPGPSFTRNFDKTFVSTVKDALRMCKDTSTQQILRETLDTLEANKQYQEGMEGLIQMWRKEKGQGASFANSGSRFERPPGPNSDYLYRRPTMSLEQRSGPGDRSHGSRRQLPPPAELASRIEEARNTAKILLQLIQSTPSEEILHNELLREFSERCQSAQKSMAGYISCDNPTPDDETMLTLIETNEQLSLATSRYQRCVLTARRALGATPSPNAEAMQNSAAPVAAPPAAPTAQEQSLFAPAAAPPRSPPRPAENMSAFGNAEEEFQPPSGPPPRQSTQRSAFLNEGESFSPPSVPPPRQLPQPITTTNRGASYSPPPGPPQQQQPIQRSTFANTSGSYSPPPSPPTAMLARLNSREQTSPTLFEPKQMSDPFADPVEHEENPAPLAYGSTSNGVPAALQHPANRPHSSTFSVDAGPTYAAGNIQPSPVDPADPYGTSPVQSRAGPISDEPVSPITPSQRRWQDLRANASYTGRQTSAAEGLTMHGGQPNQDVPEIDGHSEVGRIESTTAVQNSTVQSDAATNAYSVSPTQTRT